MLPRERLEQLAKRYVELDDLLCQPAVLGDRQKLAKLNRERGEAGEGTRDVMFPSYQAMSAATSLRG